MSQSNRTLLLADDNVTYWHQNARRFIELVAINSIFPYLRAIGARGISTIRRLLVKTQRSETGPAAQVRGSD